MNKNKKMLFLAVALVTVLILISAVNATNTTDKSIDNTISEKTSTQASNIIKEETTTKEKIETQKNKEIKKTNKTKENTKTATKTVEVNNYNELITTINNAFNDYENDEYIINLNEGIYQISSSTNLYGNSNNIKNIIINGNNQTLNDTANGARILRFNNTQITFNNLTFAHRTTNYANSNITFNQTTLTYTNSPHNSFGYYIFKNSTIETKITNKDTGTLILDDETKLGISYQITNEGTLITNKTLECIIENQNIDQDYSVDSKVTLINCNINGILGSSGNLILINCQINNRLINNKYLILKNCTINYDGDYWLTNPNSITYIDYDTTLPSGSATSPENIIYGEIPEINEITYSGKNILENQKLNMTIINNGDLTINNCNITGKITNKGNLTLVNCTLSNNNMSITSSMDGGFLIDNYGNTTMINCVVENNSLNSSRTSGLRFGAIFNRKNSILSLENTVFKNNTNNGDGYNTLILNYGVISKWNNCSFIDNTIGSYYNRKTTYSAIIPDEFTLIVTDSLFENNTFTVFEAENLTVINSKFKNNTYINLNGVEFSAYQGIAISASKLFINNCTFDGNGILSKDSGDNVGGFGGAILASILTVNNSKFINNFVNTTSTWSPDSGTGAAIKIKANNVVLAPEVNGEIYNSIFENNTVSNPSFKELPTLRPGATGSTSEGLLPGVGADICSSGNLIVVNNTFTGSYASNQASSIYAYVRSYQNRQNNITITDNTFKQCKSSLDSIVVEQSNLDSVITLENNIYTNTTINDELVLDIPSKIYAGEPITITGTYNILNTSFYDKNILEQNKFNVYINGKLNQTLDTLEFIITPTDGNMIVTVQPTISQTRKTESIRSTTLTNITITPENYDEYVFEGILLGITKDTKITFQGEFTDKEICININDLIIDGSKATFTNTLFTLEGSGITFTNMTINNTNTYYPVKNTGDNNTITYNKITITNTDGKTAAIYNKANNTEILYNTIYVDGPALSTDFSQGLGIANTQGILLLGGDKNKVEYNTITTTSSGVSSIFGTIEAITNSMQATNTQIRYNNITVNGNAKFNYGINGLGNVKNATISNNNLLITGERYTGGIQVGDSAENCIIENNNIKCVCHNTTPVDEEAITYGIITTNSNVGYKDPNNITIQNNNIDLSGSVNYGIEIYHTTNSNIMENNITVTGLRSMGIGFAHSPNNYVFGNNITTTGDSSIPLARVTEEIQPKNVGIQIQQTSTDVYIVFNNIQTYDKATQDKCVYTNSPNSYIMFNNLTSTTQVGNNAITGQPDTTIQDNNAIEQNSTTQTTTEDLTLGNSTNITAQFYDDTYTPVGDGKAIFRVNGKTLRYDNGEIIYADVINGRAELPNVNITQEWMKQGTTIQAVYMGDENTDSIITEKTPITVTKPEATITLEAPKEATAGQEITLKATVNDGNTQINSGRVSFKLNGKTLKDPKTGKALYANVENGEATITYTIPEKTKAKEYVLTAVFTDINYDRKEAESKLKVVKA